MKITPLHPSLGAEVAGVDLSRPVEAPAREALTRALAEHLALVFHDQSLTPAQYRRAAAVFGPPMEQHYSQHNMPEFPLIGRIWHRNGHPVHGSRAVYFHVSKTDHISGMTPEASRRYMGELIERMIRPEITYQHRWRRGDVLVIDNRARMHCAHGDYDRAESRVLWRIIVEGDRPRLV